ncbi:hypothetical protein JCM17844_06990 [Iodidimonas gelatinilytica]|uniref:Transmembrane protein n=1 Tax=Iodidimonas gelatinilytica TaxID=1236966 RepID=A0A5A7MM21_9PROT|nr:DUF6127 family protein [Iodidimonas gelatinilytica]GEQ97062.1 hypothetical protein JCM17844_06990 [Iodidimonas gelatinilytica]
MTDQTETAILTALVEQAQAQGANSPTLRALVEEASERGAMRVLRHVGLEDEQALRDVCELRDLLGAWRVARRTAWHTIVRWVITGLMLAIVAGLTLKLKLWPPAG